MADRTTTNQQRPRILQRLRLRRCVLRTLLAVLTFAGAVSARAQARGASEHGEPQRAGQLAELVTQNVASADRLVHRVRQIRLNVFSPPWAICHAFLLHGADFKLLDPRTGQSVSALQTVLVDPGSAVELYRGAWRFRRATLPRTFERHPGQFSYLIFNTGLRPKRTGSETERRLWLIWNRETAEFHTLLDPSWFIPAWCLVGREQPWTNKFGEQLDGDRLLGLLREQLGMPPSELPCGGTHAFYALAAVRKCRPLPLSAMMRHELDRLWSAQVRRALSSIAQDGTFNLKQYAGMNEAIPDETAWSLHIRGHLIECLFVAPDPENRTNTKLHRMVARTISDARLYLASTTGLASFSSDGTFTYASACHLAHGLRLYVRSFGRNPRRSTRPREAPDRPAPASRTKTARNGTARRRGYPMAPAE